jgi:hypothetical protein
MMKHLLLCTALGALSACASVDTPPPRLPDPGLRHATVIQKGPDSGLELKAADWRASNALVERLQGHAGHLRDAPKEPR